MNSYIKFGLLVPIGLPVRYRYLVNSTCVLQGKLFNNCRKFSSYLQYFIYKLIVATLFPHSCYPFRVIHSLLLSSPQAMPRTDSAAVVAVAAEAVDPGAVAGLTAVAENHWLRVSRRSNNRPTSLGFIRAHISSSSRPTEEYLGNACRPPPRDVVFSYFVIVKIALPLLADLFFPYFTFCLYKVFFKTCSVQVCGEGLWGAGRDKG